jgi:DNA polymerase family A
MLHLGRPYASNILGPSGCRLRRCCPQVMTTNTSTGRLSMDSPNLQNVPKERIYQGAGEGATPGPSVRCAVRRIFCAPRGFVFLSADYRQIEMRMMAHFSGDARLAAIFASEAGDAGDVFTCLAADLHAIAPSAVSPGQRAAIKTLFYGLQFGMGTGSLANRLGCNKAEAAAWKQRCLGAYPQVCAIGFCRRRPGHAWCACVQDWTVEVWQQGRKDRRTVLDVFALSGRSKRGRPASMRPAPETATSPASPAASAGLQRSALPRLRRGSRASARRSIASARARQRTSRGSRCSRLSARLPRAASMMTSP